MLLVKYLLKIVRAFGTRIKKDMCDSWSPDNRLIGINVYHCCYLTYTSAHLCSFRRSFLNVVHPSIQLFLVLNAPSPAPMIAVNLIL